MKLDAERSVEKIGQNGEVLFRDWLIKWGMPFLYIDNGIESYAPLFKNNIKRPDFMLLVDGMGLMAVDVKNYSRSKRSGGFFLNFEGELNHSMQFEQSFKLFLWYAIRDNSSDDLDRWYFISAYDALDKGVPYDKKGKNEGIYFDIAEEHFTVMTDAARIDKLVKARRGFTGFLTQAIEGWVLASKLKKR